MSNFFLFIKNIKSLFLAFSIFFSLDVSSQNFGCGTIADSNQIEYMSRDLTNRQNWDQPESVRLFPIKNHVVRRSDGSGGLNQSDITDMIKVLNDYYINANIQFYECGSINFIDNSAFFDFNQSSESSL